MTTKNLKSSFLSLLLIAGFAVLSFGQSKEDLVDILSILTKQEATQTFFQISSDFGNAMVFEKMNMEASSIDPSLTTKVRLRTAKNRLNIPLSTSLPNENKTYLTDYIMIKDGLGTWAIENERVFSK